jgi:hypothetical protein
VLPASPPANLSGWRLQEQTLLTRTKHTVLLKVRSSPQAGCSATLRPDGERAAFRGRVRGSGRRASHKDFDGLRRVEQRA